MIFKTELSVAENATEYNDQRIELSVHDDPQEGTIILLTLVEYDEDSKSSSSKTVYNFPPISLNDLVRSIGVFGYLGTAVFRGDPPYAPLAEAAPEKAA